ncbi:hypothetical protein EVAR_76235_1 [Eumeta japonica]|uniref:Uncharacterized protein n=1 Tax=Eumeta variegata TaxID=151549 RepID=A0A4C1UPJ9_EUMVA|nr:hypothetical protein EVAR_76235_1 [Eumeta japonica]
MGLVTTKVSSRIELSPAHAHVEGRVIVLLGEVPRCRFRNNRRRGRRGEGGGGRPRSSHGVTQLRRAPAAAGPGARARP